MEPRIPKVTAGASGRRHAHRRRREVQEATSGSLVETEVQIVQEILALTR
jgi:hypothetical protein